jgi:hypothetical protein
MDLETYGWAQPFPRTGRAPCAYEVKSTMGLNLVTFRRRFHVHYVWEISSAQQKFKGIGGARDPLRRVLQEIIP